MIERKIKKLTIVINVYFLKIDFKKPRKI